MPTATRTFRVFVSSTFEDLKAERDALQRDVFPRLRKLCEENNARFQAIDLRWGVRDEAALDQQAIEICLRRIECCQKKASWQDDSQCSQLTHCSLKHFLSTFLDMQNPQCTN